jgi:hypothetical protein
LSKRDEHDVADALLAKAIGDEAGLRALVENHDVPDHMAGFLAQRPLGSHWPARRRSRTCPYPWT